MVRRIACSWLPAVLALAALVAGCGVLDDDVEAIAVDPVDLGGPVRQIEVGGGTLWVDIGDELPVSVVGVDLATGSSDVRTDASDLAGFLRYHDGRLWRAGPQVDGVTTVGDPRGGSSDALLLLDPVSAEPTQQLAIGGLITGEDGVAFFDGDAWVADVTLYRNSLEPGTGPIVVDERRGNSVVAHQLVVYDEHLWWADQFGVSRYDAAGNRVFGVGFIPASEDTVDASVKFWDGLYWVSGRVDLEVDDDRAYRIDPETGELSDPIDPDDLPTRFVEADGERWELYNDDWHHNREQPASDDDRWVRVDATTGETLGEYTFGTYSVVTVAGDTLWLIDGGARRLGTVDLATLGG